MTAAGYYRGNGLLVRSDVALEEYAPAAPGVPDAVIEIGPEAATALTEATPQTWEYGGFQISPAGPVFEVPEVGAFLVTDGTHIRITPYAGCDPGQLRLYLMGSALGMLFHQRGQPILHGAAIVHARGVSLFTGSSGAGKSTLAAHLGARGHAVLADDTLPIEHDGKGGFYAWPGSRIFKLWRDALATLPRPAASEPIGQRSEKFFVHNAAPAPERPLPLREIVLLDRHNGPPVLTPIDGVHAVAMIAANTYRPEFLRLIGGEARHFEQAVQLGAAVRTYQLARPWDATRIPETLAVLEAHWDEDTASATGVDVPNDPIPAAPTCSGSH